MKFVFENIRLRELKAIVDQNKPVYDEFLVFLSEFGYAHLIDFVNESDDKKAVEVFEKYFESTGDTKLYDGVFRPYSQAKARWYFLSWIFRDAPAQRLGPMVPSVEGTSTQNKKAHLLNQIRKHVAPLFPEKASWEWPALSEIFLSRLEGSRRALKGSLFEGIVRRILVDLFSEENLSLEVGKKEKKIEEETYDAQVYGAKKTILLPVKTRETMGGGHALLFTRDIHKSISVATENGYICIPIVIAESWGGNLEELDCEHFIYIQANPNQLKEIEPLLLAELKKLIEVFKSIE